MSIKTFIKQHIPPSLYGVARSLYQLKSVPHYWLPYTFLGGKAFHPTQMTFEITFRCNLNCVMCPQATDRNKENSRLVKNLKTQSELTEPEVQSLIDQASSLGIRNFTLTGGEPLLRNDSVEILGYANSKGLNCTLLTNGTLINQDIAREMVKHRVDKVIFSLDGPKDVHDRIRRSKNAFENLLEAIRLIQTEKVKMNSNNPQLSLTCTISAINANRLSEILKIAKDLNVDMHYGYLFYSTREMEDRTNAIFPMGTAKDEDQDVDESLKKVDIVTLKQEISHIQEMARSYKIRVSFQPPLKNKDIERRFYEDGFTYCSKCFYPWYALRLNAYGDVYPCSMGVKMGNIREESLKRIWNNEKYVRFREALRKNKLFPKCSKCCVLANKLWSYLPKI